MGSFTVIHTVCVYSIHHLDADLESKFWLPIFGVPFLDGTDAVRLTLPSRRSAACGRSLAIVLINDKLGELKDNDAVNSFRLKRVKLRQNNKSSRLVIAKTNKKT